MMRTSLDHLAPIEQRQLRRVLQIILEEFDDALKAGEADFKKRGRILKIIAFGPYARGNFPNASIDILVIVNNKKLADLSCWNRANDRLTRDVEIETPIRMLVHALRDVNSDLQRGRHFFVEIASEGIALYELDNEPLAPPGKIPSHMAARIALKYFERHASLAVKFLKGGKFYRDEGDYNEAAFMLHQSIEQAYATCLLVLTNYSPASHNLRVLRGLAEQRAEALEGVWHEDRECFVVWFDLVNGAYVRSRYSLDYQISREALDWLVHRTTELVSRVQTVSDAHLKQCSQLSEGMSNADEACR